MTASVSNICNLRHRRIAIGPGQPGRCNSRDQDLCPAQGITLQLPTARAKKSRPSRGQLHRSLWPLLGLARWAILRALAVASECLRRPSRCPPWIRRLKGCGLRPSAWTIRRFRPPLRTGPRPALSSQRTGLCIRHIQCGHSDQACPTN